MKNLLNFQEFIKESLADYGLSGFGYAAGTATPTDLSSNVNAPNVRQSQQQDQMTRLRDILGTVFATQLAGGSSRFEFEIENLTVVRIFPNNSNSLDVYIKFTMDGGLYYGTFKNWASVNGPKFESPVLNHPQIKAHLENAIKLEGIFKKSLLDWFRPESGEYRALKQIKVYNEAGEIFMLPENAKVMVDEILTEDEKPIIHLSYSERKYFLTDLDYYFFNWWFQPKEKTKFYI